MMPKIWTTAAYKLNPTTSENHQQRQQQQQQQVKEAAKNLCNTFLYALGGGVRAGARAKAPQLK